MFRDGEMWRIKENSTVYLIDDQLKSGKLRYLGLVKSSNVYSYQWGESLETKRKSKSDRRCFKTNTVLRNIIQSVWCNDTNERNFKTCEREKIGKITQIYDFEESYCKFGVHVTAHRVIYSWKRKVEKKNENFPREISAFFFLQSEIIEWWNKCVFIQCCFSFSMRFKSNKKSFRHS